MNLNQYSLGLLRNGMLSAIVLLAYTLGPAIEAADFSHNSKYAVGTTHAKLESTPDGQASFAVPIEVPPGIKGFTPKVAIGYTSGAPNGLVGLGGSLSGFSAITRCGSTIAQDGVNRAVMADSGDQYCPQLGSTPKEVYEYPAKCVSGDDRQADH